MTYRYIIKEFLGNRFFFLLLVLNLSLGLVGFITLDAFKTSFQASLQNNSKSLLTADLSISARRELSENELQTLKAALKDHYEISHELSIYSMVASDKASRLTQLKVVDEKFPLYGNITFKGEHNLAQHLQNSPIIWIYPELLAQLKVQMGDQISIGEKKFTIAGIIADDVGTATLGPAMAPRIYVGMQQLSKDVLLKKGSTFFSNLLIKINDQRDINILEKTLNQNITDPAIRIRSHISASEQSGRVLNYLNDYLGLVALTALFMSCLGTAYLYRSYLNSNLKSIAIFQSLGANQWFSIRYQISILIFVGMIATVISICIAQFILPFLPLLTKEFLPTEVDTQINWKNALLAVVLSISCAVLLALPLLHRIKQLKPNKLFQESSFQQLVLKISDFIYIIPSIFCFWGLAVWQAHSIKIGSLFVAGFFLAAFLVSILTLLLLNSFKIFARTQNLALRLATQFLARQKVNSLSCFLALGLGTLLINIIPQLKSSIESELSTPGGGSLPSLFLFDIQEEQTTSLQQIVQSQNLHLNQLSPMVRADLISINGIPFTKQEASKTPETREEEQAERQRTRSYNLSFRDSLSSAEEIIEGVDISTPYIPSNELPAISLEQNFAKRLNLKLGDVLEFEILGVATKGIVKGLRKVRWTEFQPNFFILFQPGAIDDAPKTFIASLPPLNEEQKSKIQDEIVAKLSNISIIDISRVVEKVLASMSSMEIVLTYMAGLSLIVGFVVLYSIANHQARLKQRDIAMMKVLGARYQLIKTVNYIEFFILGSFSSLIGASFSIALGWVLSSFIFNGIWAFNWQLPCFTVIVVISITMIIAFLTSRKAFQIKPIELLNNG